MNDPGNLQPGCSGVPGGLLWLEASSSQAVVKPYRMVRKGTPGRVLTARGKGPDAEKCLVPSRDRKAARVAEI